MQNAKPIERPQDYGTTRGGVRHMSATLADGRRVAIYTPQTQPRTSRREGRLETVRGIRQTRTVGVGNYTLRNAAGTERQALKRYDRSKARDYLATIGKKG